MPKVKLRSGFATEVNDWARELREDMNIRVDGPLCPLALAEHLGIPVFAATALGLDGDVRRFLLSETGRKEVSAGVFYMGACAFIVANNARGIKRYASDVAHEIAHVLLRHEPTAIPCNDGARVYDEEAEAEAQKLGPGLLVSEEAALRADRLIHGGAHTLHSLSDEWGITRDVIRMRMNLVGAKKRRLLKAG